MLLKRTEGSFGQLLLTLLICSLHITTRLLNFDGLTIKLFKLPNLITTACSYWTNAGVSQLLSPIIHEDAF